MGCAVAGESFEVAGRDTRQPKEVQVVLKVRQLHLGGDRVPGYPFHVLVVRSALVMGQELDRPQDSGLEPFVPQVVQGYFRVLDDIMKQGGNPRVVGPAADHDPDWVKDVGFAGLVARARVRPDRDLEGSFQVRHSGTVAAGHAFVDPGVAGRGGSGTMGNVAWSRLYLLSSAAALVSLPLMSVEPPIGNTMTSEQEHLWLEEISSERALSWARSQSQRTLGILQGDPRYEDLHSRVLEILESRDRIPYPSIAGGKVRNFWQDAASVRGLWRQTDLDGYLSVDPPWETLLDVDALAAHERANWVFKGVSSLQPSADRVLIRLSDGGKDAATLREFDVPSRRFVEDGFVLPESKGGAEWADADTLLAWRDFGPGTVTMSGYPKTVRLLRRGEALEDAAEVFRGEDTDVSVAAYALREPGGRLRALVLHRQVTFHESQAFELRGGVAVPWHLPPRMTVQGYLAGQIVGILRQDWVAGDGSPFAAGDLAAWTLEDLQCDPKGAVPALLMRPGVRETVEQVEVTRASVVVAFYENVRGAVDVLRPTSTGWSRERVRLPENQTVGIVAADTETDDAFVSVTGFLDPSSLWLVNALDARARQVKALRPRFDSSGLQVLQYEAISRDGTRVPYFLVARDGIPADGSSPTILHGYGGFQVSQLPYYSAAVGRLWLERGGAYAVANTRGGGEFGPSWHQAAIGEKRDRVHEDFEAVARDLFERRITSPRRLGIVGGSQGGLLMGVLLTRHPELIHAAVIQVPLFDMLRYHKLLAGASWIGEYGDPENETERRWLVAYSPYQNLAAHPRYPEVFIHASTKDDRVHPAHARRAVARLQELGQPVLYYENTDGGHSAAANLRETARRLALEYTYLSRRLMD